ncbi:MAG: DUF6677 family protein [Acidobacteriota bacterium]
MRPTFPRWKAYALALPTLLLPGLSHLCLGRRGRAAAFFLIVGATYATGLHLSGALFPFDAPNWLYRLGAVGQAGLGLLYVGGRALGLGKLGPEAVTDVMFGYGSTFLVTAGLMNMLLMMDAFDIAVGRKA